jgi:hypothetical protein
MKTSTLSAALMFLATTAFAAPVAHSRVAVTQQSCAAAPAVARAYLAAQAGRKLTMSRAAVIAEITKNTGADGEFAGLKPCDSGYPNAVRFYIDEVIKAGTDNSTPKTDDGSTKK